MLYPIVKIPSPKRSSDRKAAFFCQKSYYHPDYHGIRLDVYAKGNSKAFNIEMQIQPKNNLPRRTRYYHDQIDMSELRPSEALKKMLHAAILCSSTEEFLEQFKEETTKK
ncbi:MAG: PD-(D/E)XK nuclease family transposase [Lachnospiraceae bacterium]